MLVKDIIIKACDFLENEELAKALTLGEELSSEQASLLEKLVKCFNLVRNEVEAELLPKEFSEKVMAENGKVTLDKFKNKVVDVVSVKDKWENIVRFKLGDELFTEDNGELVVIYHALPVNNGIDDEINSRLPERVFAYGVIKEYYFIQTLYEDAKVWDERFKNSLENMQRKKGLTMLPRRRWI